MHWRSILFPAVVLTVPCTAMAQEAGALVPKGKLLSEKHCSRCHVVDASKPFTGISSTPSFSLMVNALEDWEDRFQSFHARLPHPSIVRFEGDEPDPNVEDLRPPVELKFEDVDAIVAFARSLLKQ